MAASFEKKYDVFISHRTETDGKLAADLCAFLEAKGLTCWIAPRDVDAGSNYFSKIIEGVWASKIMLLIFNKNSIESQYVIDEVNEAYDKKLKLLPFRTDYSELPRELIMALRSRQWMNATDGKPEDHFEKAYEKSIRLLYPNDNEIRYVQFLNEARTVEAKADMNKSRKNHAEALGQYRNAFKIVNQAISVLPGRQEGIMLRSSLLLKIENTELNILLEQSKLDIQNKNYSAAREKIDNILAKDKSNKDAADLLKQLEGEAGAELLVWEKIIEEAEAHYIKEDYKEALNLFQRVPPQYNHHLDKKKLALLNPGNIEAYNNLFAKIVALHHKVIKEIAGSGTSVDTIQVRTWFREHRDCEKAIGKIRLPADKLKDRIDSVAQILSGIKLQEPEKIRTKKTLPWKRIAIAVSAIGLLVFIWKIIPAQPAFKIGSIINIRPNMITAADTSSRIKADTVKVPADSNQAIQPGKQIPDSNWKTYYRQQLSKIGTGNNRAGISIRDKSEANIKGLRSLTTYIARFKDNSAERKYLSAQIKANENNITEYISANYEIIKPEIDLFIVRKQTLYGIINKYGREVLKCTYALSRRPSGSSGQYDTKYDFLDLEKDIWVTIDLDKLAKE